jgi:hypothetical protein
MLFAEPVKEFAPLLADHLPAGLETARSGEARSGSEKAVAGRLG